MIKIDKIKDYKISNKTIIINENGQPSYDMYIVTLIYSNNTKKEIKVFSDINAIDVHNKPLAKAFIIDRLLGKNGLMEKEGRDDYIFLGQLIKNGICYTADRYYRDSKTNKNAQQHFDEEVYPSLKKIFNDDKKEIKELESQRGEIYNEIKSPFDNENTIQQLVELYASGKVTNSNSLYRQITDFDSGNENDKQKYLYEFQENILFPNLAELYNNMKFGRDETIPNDPRVKKIFTKLKDYEELDNYATQNHTRDIYRIYNNMNLYEDSKNKYLNELRRLNLTDEELDFRLMVGWMKKQLINRFNGGVGIMGFHVNPQNLKCANRQPNREKSEMKFYINAGYDTYRFARIFQEKCKQNNLNYYFKVVNPYNGEHKRSDKLCIYTELKDADVFLQLIKDISVEHPDIEYGKPPLFAGTIQDFIGVGTDNISENRSSYNYEMSKICFSIMEKFFKGMSKNEILNIIKRNRELLEKIKSMIVSQAISLGLSSEKICIREDSIPKLKNAELQRKIKQAQEEGKSLDEQITNTKYKIQGIGE